MRQIHDTKSGVMGIKGFATIEKFHFYATRITHVQYPIKEVETLAFCPGG
jgi:hypothetical protein